MLNKALFSSASAEWETPRPFFKRLDAEFGFTLDVCARPENAKCPRFYTPGRTAWRRVGPGSAG